MNEINDPYSLERFIEKHKYYYPLAYGEIYHGMKQSHWMWWIFPQIEGLGISPTARRYAIHDLDEARAFLNHPVLGKNLREITELLVNNPYTDTTDAVEIFPYPDNLKLHSSMTLFLLAGEEELFQKVLDKFFDGKKDDLTLKLLQRKD